MNKVLIPLFLLLLTACTKQRTFDEKCVSEAKEQTEKNCPKTITPGITMDSITYSIPGRAFSYYYSMSQSFDNQEAINAGKEKFREALRAQIASSLDLKKFKDKGITFRYIYISKTSKKLLLQETFTKEDYSK